MDSRNGTTTERSPASSKKGETVRVNGMPLDEYLKRSDRLMSDHPEPSPQANSEKQ